MSKYRISFNVSEPYTCNLELNGIKPEIEIDTGCSLSLIRDEELRNYNAKGVNQQRVVDDFALYPCMEEVVFSMTALYSVSVLG